MTKPDCKADEDLIDPDCEEEPIKVAADNF